MATDAVHNDPFNIPFLRYHMYTNRDVQLTTRAGRNILFFKDSRGKVYADHPVDLSRQRRCNDIDRRAWCALAGVKIADLRALVKAQRERAGREENDRQIRSATRVLEQRGYRVTKRRKPKGA